MKNIVLLFCVGVLLIFTINGCKSNPVDPPPVKVEVQPGSRNYTWDVKNLTIPLGESVTFNSMWGADPNNIWLLGDATYGPLELWHFNGSQWNYSLPGTLTEGGLSAIWGSSANNIWLGNTAGILWNYNGSEWIEKTKLRINYDYEKFYIQNLWGVNDQEIYLLGGKPAGDKNDNIIPALFKYSNNKWSKIQIPVNSTDLNYYDIKKSKNGDLLIQGVHFYSFNGTLLVWNGSVLKELIPPTDKYLSLSNVGDDVYVNLDNVIYKYDNGNLVLVKDLSSYGPGMILGMRSEKDIILTNNKDGLFTIGQYNGTDFKVIYKLESNVWPRSHVVFEKDVFIYLFDLNNSNNYQVLHGKLKD